MTKSIIILFAFSFFIANAQKPDSIVSKPTSSLQPKRLNFSETFHKINETSSKN